MTSEKLMDLFVSRKALLEGHFILSSGLHSNRYMQSALLLHGLRLAVQLGQAIAEKFPEKIDTVISPAIGGLIIGHEVARAKGARAIFSEKDDQGKPILRRGFQISEKEKVLVVEDVITTGLSTSEVLELVKQSKATMLGVGSMVNRMRTMNEKLLAWKIPVLSLLTLEINSWDPGPCPLCKEGTPAVKPGSRKK